jgi:Rad3-related DNA helicase
MDNSMEHFCLGQTLHNVIKNIPGGVLVFFPCYKMIEEVVATWKVCFF